jgi:hypothetical protein
VDKTTIKQIYELAKAKGQIPVNLDHGSGISSMNGFCDGFRIDGSKLRGDWHLLKTHEETETMLERAERQPGTFGLSAAFKGPPKGVMENGSAKARAEALLSFDVVVRPAANVGLFSVKEPHIVDTQNFSSPVKLFTLENPMARQNTQTQEASNEDIVAALNNLNERFEAQTKELNELKGALDQQGGGEEEGYDVDQLEALFNMNPAQLAQFNRENNTKISRAEIVQAVDQHNANVQAQIDAQGQGEGEGEGEGGEAGGEGEAGNQHAEGAAGTPGLETSAAGTQLAALRQKVIQLEAKLSKREQREEEEAARIEFEAIQNNFATLQEKNQKLVEFAEKVVAENEALKVYLSTGTRPVKAGIDNGVRLFSANGDGELHPFQARVKEIEKEKKCSNAQAILFASRETGGSAKHADWILSLRSNGQELHS